jgi:hypothetical protein
MTRTLLLSCFLLFLLPACGGSTSGDGGPSSSGSGGSGEPGGGLPGEIEPAESTAPAVPSSEGELPAPEFKGARTAIQPITETVAALGSEMAEHISKVEQAILLGDSAKADEQIIAAITAMKGEPKIDSNMRRALLVALASDLAAVQDDDGKPTVTVVEHKDRCCADDGSCSTEFPGATCWELQHGTKALGCGGTCVAEEADVPEESKPADDDDSGGAGDSEPAPEEGSAPAPEEGSAPATEEGSAPATEEAAQPEEGEKADKTE